MSRFDYENNFWIYTDYLTVKRWIPYYSYMCDALIRPIASTKTGLSYLDIDGYLYSFPKCEGYPEFEIIKAYKTNIDLTLFHSGQELNDYFKKYDIIATLK